VSSTVTAREVITSLIDAGQTVATCESLTAGLLAATLADVPGASAVLRGGLVTYATDLKHTLARVPQEVLVEHGPVARETAIAMAGGVRDVCGADWGVSLTGVAGPDPQDGHPVGEVWVGVAGPEDTGVAELAGTVLGSADLLVGDRAAIRRQAVAAALAVMVQVRAGHIG
jgi:competence/damage-inducible protein cinA C-terminal domain